MKKLFILLFTLISLSAYSQHGNFTDLRLINGSAGLAGTNNGTVYFDIGLAKFQFRQGGSWLELGTHTGSLTTGYVPKATGTTSLGNSLIYDNATNIGIGTASPGAKLDVIGNVQIGDVANAAGSLDFRSSDGTWQTGSNNAGNGTSGNQWFIYDSTVPSYRFSIQRGTGAVGIGTIAPQTRLHLISGDAEVLRVEASGADPRITISRDGSLKGGFRNINFQGVNLFTDAGSLSFSTNSTDERLTILTGGNVGIGDTSPSTALDVNGTISSQALTSGRIPVAGSGGALADDADLSFSTSTLSATNINMGTASISGNRTLAVVSSTTDAGISIIGTQGNGTMGVIASDLDVTNTNDTKFSTGSNTNLSIAGNVVRNITSTTAAPLTIWSADGNSTSLTGSALTLSGGNGYSSGNNAGGAISIISGSPNGSSAHGLILIDSNSNNIGNAGDIIVRAGAGGTGVGDITIAPNGHSNTSYLFITNLPTSCSGVPTGAIANVGGVLTVCP